MADRKQPSVESHLQSVSRWWPECMCGGGRKGAVCSLSTGCHTSVMVDQKVQGTGRGSMRPVVESCHTSVMVDRWGREPAGPACGRLLKKSPKAAAQALLYFEMPLF
eukprot:349650-Chlamydomonas_euryale.AAC.2